MDPLGHELYYISVLLGADNGDHSELFGASRGLCQGDPLSPYLFLLLAKGLGRLLKRNVELGTIQGWRWGRDLPSQSHLQFVDDTALMGMATVSEATSLRQLLDVYLEASGQRINEDKSSIFFFNTPVPIQRRIANILRFQIGTLPCMYLGIPISVRHLPRGSWQNIIDKFWMTVNHWTHRWLSFAGQVQLLKSFVQALPTYRCMLQVAPVGFLKELDYRER
jgi:hypothetical protein